MKHTFEAGRLGVLISLISFKRHKARQFNWMRKELLNHIGCITVIRR